MKSWLKALLISIVILATGVFFLPNIAKQGLTAFLPWAMETAGLRNPKVLINKISWHLIDIDSLSFEMPSSHSKLYLEGISLSFSPSLLLSGKLSSLILNQGKLSIEPPEGAIQEGAVREGADKKSNSQKNADPKALTIQKDFVNLLSLQEIFKKIPIHTIKVKQFITHHPMGTIDSNFVSNQQQAILNNTVHTPLLLKDIQHNLIINNTGMINSHINILNQEAPILNLQAQWKSKQNNEDMILSLQQSADIQSWLKLIPTTDKNTIFHADVAIQAWNLELSLPKYISSAELLTALHAQGLLQVKVSNLDLRENNTPESLIENTDIDINIRTQVDPSQEEQWQLVVESFDVKSDSNNISDIKLNIQQGLAKALKFSCKVEAHNTNCNWKGDFSQHIRAKSLSNELVVKIEGSYQSTDGGADKFISEQTFNINTLQGNTLWPKFKNTSQGSLIIQAQNQPHDINGAWHWQLNLPFGINNTSKLLEPLLKEEPSAKLSEIEWQLLPDWQLSGINAELTRAKVFSIIINKLDWKHHQKSLSVDYANINCNLDWLKLQYSPQLRSQQSLTELPLNCDWDIKNKPSQWEKWPLPAINLTGELAITSLDLEQAKINSKMKATGLSNALNFTLLAQHDFSGLQQGSAQLYVDNLELNWDKMGLPSLSGLTQTQLLAGSISAQGWIQWQQYHADIFDDSNVSWRWKPDLMIRADDLAGIYQETTTWEDIDIQLAIRRPLYEEFKINSQLSALSINPGINIENILARSTATIQEDFKQALIVVEEVHSSVLGGRINVPLVRYDTSESTNAFGIEVEGIQIEQLAALEPSSGVKATGQLDGVLPIVLLPEGPQVPAGSLFARDPGGVIQFTGDAAESLKQSDPTVGLAMQVLSDFRYDKLQTDVTYQPNGELKLGLQFQGKNPTFFDGQATHLNLNLDYNLLDLLSSLRINNDIVQKLENKYQ